MLVAPSEPPLLRALGLYSPQCEAMGVDILILGKLGLVGVQRKTCSDLVASLRDGRIFDLVTKGEGLTATILLLEGDWEFDRAGNSRTCRGFTEAQLTGLKLSLQRKHGILIVESRSLEGTAALLGQMESWFASEDKVSSLLAVPKAESWGAGKKATALRVWMQVPGISLGGAIALHDAVGLPLALTCTDAELRAVPKIGPKRIAAIKETFNGGSQNGAVL